MSSAPWIWPRMTSGFSLGSWVTVADAVRVCGWAPAAKLSTWTSSVRAWDEFFVVAPPTGAQNVTPALSAVSHGGARRAGLIVSASPDSALAVGRVSCQPSSFTSDGVGAGAGFGGVVLVHAVSTSANTAPTHAIARVGRVLNGASPIAGRAVAAA